MPCGLKRIGYVNSIDSPSMSPLQPLLTPLLSPTPLGWAPPTRHGSLPVFSAVCRLLQTGTEGSCPPKSKGAYRLTGLNHSNVNIQNSENPRRARTSQTARPGGGSEGSGEATSWTQLTATGRPLPPVVTVPPFGF